MAAVSRRSATATFAVLLLSLTHVLSRPAPAAAGSYVVHECSSSATTASWQFHGSLGVESFRVCPNRPPDPYEDLRQGLGLYERLDQATSANADGWAEWRLSAPVGTRIAAARVDRDIGNRSDEWRPYGRVDGTDIEGETCVRPLGESFCRIRGERLLSGLDATTIAWGIRCPTTSAPFCSHGGTLHEVWALVLSASVTLEDVQPPAVHPLVPSAFVGGTWSRGAASVTFDASDNTGIRRRRVVEGATTWAARTAPGASAGGCGDGSGDAYTYLQPCAGARGLNGTQTVTVPDVCVFGDGVHELRAAAEDTGGGETRSAPFSVRVDCTAPEVWVAAGPSPRLAGDVLAPAVSASDGASGVATVERQLSVDGATWMTAPASVEGEAGRTYRFRARARDEAGNASGWVESAPVSFVAAAAPVPAGVEHHPGQWEPGAPASTAEAAALPTPPAALTAPGELARAVPAPPAAARSGRLRIGRVRRRGSTLIVEGTAPRAYAGIVRVSVRFAGSGRTVVATTRATARSGRWRAALRTPRRSRVRRVQATARTRGVRAARPYTPRRRA